MRKAASPASDYATKRNNSNRHTHHRRCRTQNLFLFTIATALATLALTATAKIRTVCALRRHAPAFAAAAASSTSSRLNIASVARSSAAAVGTPTPEQIKRRITTRRTTTATTTTNMASSSTTLSSSSLEIPQNLRGLFGGSGVEGMSNPLMNHQILNLLPSEKKESMSDVKVLYLGTATYDIDIFREKQTARFVEKGCQVSSLNVSDTANAGNDDATLIDAIQSADIILVSGGNTLYAVDKWTQLGLVPHLRAAMERGCILTGGSAGAICWFDSGHSDSADPETYREPMVAKYGCRQSDDGGGDDDDDDGGEKGEDESSEYDPSDKKQWKYLRVPGLGFVPGPFVCCPHHDRVQSNGLLRAHDFDQMLLARAKSSQKSVLGIGIDHYSAFVVEGERYKVYVLPEKPGSVSLRREGKDDDGDNGAIPVFDVDDDGTARGVPGVWLKRVRVGAKDDDDNTENLEVEAMVCPPEGKLADLIEYGGDNLPSGQEANLENDENYKAVETCRKENPSGIKI